MRRIIGSIVPALGIVLLLTFGATAAAAESWNLFRSLGVIAVPELAGLDSLAPVAVLTVVGFAGFGAVKAYHKVVNRNRK